MASLTGITNKRRQSEGARSRSPLSPEIVWDVLTAIERWLSWNPDVKSMSIQTRGAQRVGPEDLGVGNEPRRRNRREVHDRVRGRVCVHAGEHLQRLLEVDQVGSDERAPVVAAGGHEVDVL